MHADRAAVTIQSNKMVLNEVKYNSVLLEYLTENKLFGQPTISSI